MPETKDNGIALKAAKIAAAGAIGAAVIGGVFQMMSRPAQHSPEPSASISSPPPSDSIYRVRATVVSPGGIPDNDVRIWSSVGGEPKQVAGGWQFDIPAASLPADGSMTVYAEKPSAFQRGQEDLHLTPDDVNPTVTVTLEAISSARIRGIVVHRETNDALSGVRVSIEGRPDDEAVLTSDSGTFELAAHAANGQQVRVRAEKEGFTPDSRYRMAGTDTVTIRLLPRGTP